MELFLISARTTVTIQVIGSGESWVLAPVGTVLATIIGCPSVTHVIDDAQAFYWQKMNCCASRYFFWFCQVVHPLFIFLEVLIWKDSVSSFILSAYAGTMTNNVGIILNWQGFSYVFYCRIFFFFLENVLLKYFNEYHIGFVCSA